MTRTQRKEPVIQGRDLKWYWRKLNRSGEIVATGHYGYSTKWNAKRALLKRFPNAVPQAEVRGAKNG